MASDGVECVQTVSFQTPSNAPRPIQMPLKSGFSQTLAHIPIPATTADIVDRLERLQALSLEREEEEAAAQGGEEGEGTAHLIEDRARAGDKRSAVSPFHVSALAPQQHTGNRKVLLAYLGDTLI